MQTAAAAVFAAVFGDLVLLLLSRNPGLAWEHLQEIFQTRQTLLSLGRVSRV